MTRRIRSGASVLVTGLCLGVLFVVAGGSAARALEGHQNEAMGTMKSVDAEKLTLTKTDGTDLEVALPTSTKVRRGDSEVDRGEIQAGERAVVDYEAEEDGNHALEVRLGAKKP